MTITRLMAIVGHRLYKRGWFPRLASRLSYGAIEREAEGKP